MRWTWCVTVLVCVSAVYAAEESPVTAAGRALTQMEAQGRDVKALRAELETLSPEWSQIERERDALHKRVAAFAPKMQALMQKIQGQTGAGHDPAGGNDPVEAVENGLKQLEATGRDVLTLRAELEVLRPAWNEISLTKQKLAQAADDQRATVEKELRAQVEAFRPKLEALAQKVHARAGGPGR